MNRDQASLVTNEGTERLRDAALSGERRRFGGPGRAVRRLARLRTPEAARALAEVYLTAPDEEVRSAAEQALAAVAGPPAVDALCELAIAAGDDRLRGLLDRAGRLPSDPGRRTLWLLLGGRLDEAAALDYDGGLLRAASRAADPVLRSRIAAQARVAGWAHWVRAAAGQPGDDLAEFTDEERDTTASVLSAAGRWDELWRLVPRAPLPWAAQLLGTLAGRGWRPADDADRVDYARLTAIVARCTTPPSATSLFHPPQVLADEIKVLNALTVGGRGDLLVMGQLGHPEARVWRLPSLDPAGEFDTPFDLAEARSVAITADGSLLAVGARGGVRLHFLAGQDLSQVWLPGPQRVSVTALAFTPDGAVLVGADDAGQLRLWRMPSGERIGVLDLPGREKFTVPCLAITPDGRTLFVGSRSKWGAKPHRHETVFQWHLPSGEPAPGVAVGRLGVNSVAVTPDGRFLVTAGVDSTTRVWRLPSRQPVTSIEYDGYFSDVTMSADGRFLAGVRSETVVEVRRLPSAELITSIDSDFSVQCLALSADNRLLIGSGRGKGHPLMVWHLPSGARAGRLAADTAESRILAFTADGTAVAGQLRQVRAWRPEPVLTGRAPVGRVTLAEADRLRERTRGGPDEPWGELLAALVHRRHRHDIELGAGSSPGALDIDVS